jgi:putative phosphoesterase
MEIERIDWRKLTCERLGGPRVGALRLGLIADTHGPVAEDLRGVLDRCHILVHAGDVLDARALACRGCNRAVVAVRGNNDRPAGAPDALGLPDVLELILPGGCLVVIHGDRYPAAVRADRLRRDFPQARAVLCGHSHRMGVDRAARPWVLNPGAAGRVRTGGGASALVLFAWKTEWRLVGLRAHPGGLRAWRFSATVAGRVDGLPGPADPDSRRIPWP